MSKRGVFQRLLVLAASGVLVLGTATACGSDDENLRPSARGPVVTGHATCAWVVSSDECKNSGVPEQYWYQMPQQQPANYHQDHTWDIISMMFLWHLMYHSWYGAPAYYNSYVPVSYRTTYVTNYVTHFDSTYTSQEKTAEKKATYKTSSGKTVTGDKVSPKRFTSQNNGGDRNTKACNVFRLDSYDSLILAKGGFGGSRGGGSRGGGFGSRGNSGSRNSNAGGDRGTGSKSKKGC